MADALLLAQVRVVVVSGCESTTDALGRLLAGWGHDVAVARDGATALELARIVRPHMVILDADLPGVDPCETARRLRQSTGHGRLHLIAITGEGQDEAPHRFQEVDCDFLLVKPLEADHLRHLLRAAAGCSSFPHRPA